MRNSLFMGVLVAAILILTAGLAFTVINHEAAPSEPVNDISLGGEFSCGAGLTVKNTSDLIMVTNSSGSGSRVNMTVYRPKTLEQGWYWVGDLVEPSFNAPAGQVTLVYANDPTALAPPADWKLVWKDYGSGAYLDTSFWVPVPPKGYIALGGVAVQGYNKPVALAQTVFRRCFASTDLTLPYRSDLGIRTLSQSGFWGEEVGIL